ncbi:DNAse I-like superfamily protein [Wolffia australiana]
MTMSITVMTLNLHDPDQEKDGPNCWEKRRDICVSVIASYSPAILCTQQGVNLQLEFLQQCLPGYAQFGVSRSGSEDPSDEHCVIFYEKEKVELIEGGTFWLSESPSVPGSMAWGSKVPCIATWATFQLKRVESPGFSFQVVNTNMDEFSPRARRRGALLTWQHIASLPPNLPVLYCGGFNTQKESTAGRFLLGRSREHGVVGDMRDAWHCSPLRKNAFLIRTFHGFKGDQHGMMESLKLILRVLCLCWDRQTQDLHDDWILFRGRLLVPVRCEVVNDTIDGLYPSSHYPMFAEFMLPRSIRLPETQPEDR